MRRGQTSFVRSPSGADEEERFRRRGAYASGAVGALALVVVGASGCTSPAPHVVRTCTSADSRICQELTGELWTEALASSVCGMMSGGPGTVAVGRCPASPVGTCVIGPGTPGELRQSSYSTVLTETFAALGCCAIATSGSGLTAQWIPASTGIPTMCSPDAGLLAPDGG